MSVVGFDIGNDNCVVAIVKPKAIQILQNDVSKYETPSVVSFTNNRRQIGSAGASSAGMYPLSTVSQIKRLIGQNYDDPGMADEFKLLPFKIIRGADGGILITVDYLKKTQVFTPVEILAMLLSHLKQMTERNGDGTPVVDCVIGIPSYFNDIQRVAYLNAAEIAGLKPLRLIHDGTATAIGYGYYNQDINSPTNIVFVDVGQCDTQVTVAEFDRKKVTILRHAYDRNVGGRDFDRIVYKYFADKFNEEHKIDIDVDDKNSYHKARIRLMAACEKAKKVLTANREANLSIDCFVDDKDLVGSIKIEEFENLSKLLLERVIKTCNEALMDVDGKLTISDIHSVELVGSGSRIPAIGSSVGKFFDNKPPNRTLNGSECVARGCALRGAILRSSNRGFTFEVQDSIPFSIGFILRQKSSKFVQIQEQQNRKKYVYKEQRKLIKNRHTDESDRNLPRQESSWGIEPEAILDQFSEIKSSTVLFQKGLQFPCILHHHILNASQDFILSSFYEDQGAFLPYTSQRSRHFKVGTFQMNRFVPRSARVEISIDHYGIINILSAKKQGFLDQWLPLPARNYSENIKFHEISPFGLTQESVYNAKEREKRLLQCDKLVEAVQHEKNSLETFFYDTQNKLKDRYKSFAKMLEKERISQNLVNAEILINDEGEHDIQTYLTTLHELQELVHPIESRCKHREECAQAIKELQNSISNQKSSASSNLVKSYCSCTEELLSAIQKLLRILPKDIEQLPKLVEKIKRITNTTNESNYLPKDISTTKEKYASLFKETSRHSLSARHEDKLTHPLHLLEEGVKVEEASGQAVAQLLYAIFDVREKLSYLKCLDISDNKEYDSFLQTVTTTCNDIEKHCEEMKPQDISPDDIKSMQKNLDGLHQEIQQYVALLETHAQASKNCGKLNPQGSSTKEATLTQAAEDEITDLEKQLFGRYRYFVQTGEEKNISEMIKYMHQHKDFGMHLQLKAHLASIIDPIKKCYQEYKNERIQALGEFYECIYEMRLTTRSMPNNEIKSEVLRRCDEMEKQLSKLFPKPRSSWMDSDNQMWSSDIRMKMMEFKTSCESLMQKPDSVKQMHNQEKSESGKGTATSS